VFPGGGGGYFGGEVGKNFVCVVLGETRGSIGVFAEGERVWFLKQLSEGWRKHLSHIAREGLWKKSCFKQTRVGGGGGGGIVGGTKIAYEDLWGACVRWKGRAV